MWLFRIPLSRHEICKAWANAMGKENFKPTGNSRVCCEHFSIEDYFKTKNGKWELKPDAIPDNFIDPKVRKMIQS